MHRQATPSASASTVFDLTGVACWRAFKILFGRVRWIYVGLGLRVYWWRRLPGVCVRGSNMEVGHFHLICASCLTQRRHRWSDRRHGVGMRQSWSKSRRTWPGVRTAGLSRSGNHVFQAQLTLLCNLVEIQKLRLGQPRFQKFLAGLAQGIRNVPTCTHEGRILGDIRGAHGERRDIQREVQRW